MTSIDLLERTVLRLVPSHLTSNVLCKCNYRADSEPITAAPVFVAADTRRHFPIRGPLFMACAFVSPTVPDSVFVWPGRWTCVPSACSRHSGVSISVCAGRSHACVLFTLLEGGNSAFGRPSISLFNAHSSSAPASPWLYHLGNSVKRIGLL